LEDRQAHRAADDHPDIAPGLSDVETIQGMTSRHARLATGAAIEIHLERQLLTRTGRGRRHQGGIILALKRCARPFMELREALDH